MYNEFTDTMRHGDTHYMQFVVNINGVAQDITTWAKFWFTAKLSTDDLDAGAVFQRTDAVGGGIARTTPAVGLVTVTIAPANTSGLLMRPHLLLCDFQGVDGSGNVWSGISGSLFVWREVTRSVV